MRFVIRMCLCVCLRGGWPGKGRWEMEDGGMFFIKSDGKRIETDLVAV